ncbi:tetratricopeptide repeat protein [Sphingomonas gei]|uniref:Tetratricopeptide repeat protein n=1 Tax=Sphingomonas gei TaxID=1395960 RepID=A0A4S1XGF9_9SPHN|nr:tetratricopeptide repeat protein [Sphingomonas gei]TGX55075.1 tetratricopeptide repeat protein [Sphingomonas gei]
MLFYFLSLQAATAAAPQAGQEPPRFAACMDLATGDPSQGVTAAGQWRTDGGGMLARQCLGVAYANQKRWPSAAAAFEEAAREAETSRDARASNYWAQAGNAWLAAGEHVKARAALDAALASGHLAGLALGEARLDHARALVAAGDADGARADLDRALQDAAADPLAWLLSATLARRQGDLPRAKTDIAEALKRAADDAQVQLEAGNIAASAGDEAGARAAWGQVLTLSPGSATADSARKALAQFGASER